MDITGVDIHIHVDIHVDIHSFPYKENYWIINDVLFIIFMSYNKKGINIAIILNFV